MSPIDGLIIYIIHPLLNLLMLVVIVGVILSWLISFNVVNGQNQFVGMIWRMTNAITEPLLGPIRRVLPTLGGMDFSPIILILLIGFVQGYVLTELVRLF
ncbi:YggT family protein [uncultured Maricaulis sp.]|uniref:YggT family protein n=1 Tax=uncultured Maricaulis sp. TaxID=174710 RepID=UPI002619FA91|nr:YggT family protein [uncultured Maricaulis sp.]